VVDFQTTVAQLPHVRRRGPCEIRSGSILRAPLVIRTLLLAAVLAAAGEAAPRPKLLVLVVAEQFRSDYLERHRAALAAGGLQKLLQGGAVFPDCRYEYAATYPAAGAAVLATGAYPERNGIVAEQWYDRRTKNVVRAAEDAEAALVGSDAPRRPAGSPRRLAGTTLADQMRLGSEGRSRVVAVSLRDQTAVMLGGRNPAGCYWMDDGGRFVTSTYYKKTLPEWVEQFQQKHQALRVRGRPWRAIDAPESAPPLRVVDGLKMEDFLATYLASPLAMDDQFAFARTAAEAEKLGQGPAPDLLAISVSSLYLVGLEAGADSPLVRDMVLRLDRQLEELLAALEGRLGAGSVWVVFTATQGLAESRAAIEDARAPSGRVPGEQLAGLINTRLAAAFGRAHYVEKFVFPFLYLRREAVAALRPEDVSRVAGEAALSVEGVADYWGADRTSNSLLGRCRFPDRSGDLLLAYQPYYWERVGDWRGVTTGSYYSYDTQVPLLLYGPAFRSGIFARTISPTDLAPTLAVALGITPPASSTGRILTEALADP
jgi:predicted AlkP superfamily pyrophosphatase or phosphodiesterase